MSILYSLRLLIKDYFDYKFFEFYDLFLIDALFNLFLLVLAGNIIRQFTWVLSANRRLTIILNLLTLKIYETGEHHSTRFACYTPDPARGPFPLSRPQPSRPLYHPPFLPKP